MVFDEYWPNTGRSPDRTEYPCAGRNSQAFFPICHETGRLARRSTLYE
jgi:hypothetical protein